MTFLGNGRMLEGIFACHGQFRAQNIKLRKLQPEYITVVLSSRVFGEPKVSKKFESNRQDYKKF